MSQRDDNSLTSASNSLGPATLKLRRVNGKAVDNPVRRKLLPPGVVSPEALELFNRYRRSGNTNIRGK
jgi:hypothetical protein